MKRKKSLQMVFLDPDLDSIETPCIVFPFLEDEKPLKGLLGFADWRMNGRISEQLLRDRVQGNRKEVVLIPSDHRMRAQNILMLGLGPSQEKEISQGYHEALHQLCKTLLKARVGHFVFVLNGVLSQKDQIEWLADFMTSEKETDDHFPLSWAVVCTEANLQEDFAWFQKRYGKHIDCIQEGASDRAPDQRPFAPR